MTTCDAALMPVAAMVQANQPVCRPVASVLGPATGAAPARGQALCPCVPIQALSPSTSRKGSPLPLGPRAPRYKAGVPVSYFHGLDGVVREVHNDAAACILDLHTSSGAGQHRHLAQAHRMRPHQRAEQPGPPASKPSHHRQASWGNTRPPICVSNCLSKASLSPERGPVPIIAVPTPHRSRAAAAPLRDARSPPQHDRSFGARVRPSSVAVSAALRGRSRPQSRG